MLGKPEWFERRKYSGWGLTPKTWQGWAYIALMALPVLVMPVIPAGAQWATYLIYAWLLIAAADVLDLMVKVRRDEREKMHEAVAERNAAWAMVVVITIGIGFQAAQSAASKSFQVDLFLIAAIVAGLAAKALTNYHLDKTN